MNTDTKYFETIIDKRECIATFSADDLIKVPSQVDSSYNRHIFTHISIGETDEYEKKLVQKLNEGVSLVGYISAPYGYGKTTTAIHAWITCQDKQIMTVPPFTCNSLKGIMDATYGWIKYKFGMESPDYVVDIEGIYRKYADLSIDSLAKKDCEDVGIPFEQARKSIENKISSGILNLRITPEILTHFLDSCMDTVLKAGFKGLIIFADEFQTYFDQKNFATNEITNEWRELIWNIINKNKKYGIIFIIPEEKESTINERAGDIIQRLREQRLVINLKNVYDRKFPAYLMEEYAKKFKFDPSKLVDKYTLSSVGQIVTDKDLGNGPRTVVNIFKLIFQHYNNTSQQYTVINLINSYLDGNIVHDGPDQKIVSSVKKALSSDRVKSENDRSVIKLLAAFPRGCPLEVLDIYGLHNNFVNLEKSLLGDVIKNLAEGPTLKDLSNQSDGEVSKVDELIKKFRDQYDRNDICAEAAEKAFIKYIFAEIFGERKGGLIGFAGLNNIYPTRYGYKECIITGSFDEKYPYRTLHLTISIKENKNNENKNIKENKKHPIVNPNEDIDLGFYLNYLDYGQHEIIKYDTNRILIVLDLNKKIARNGQFPNDLRKLQDFISPEEITPLLSLSLTSYIDKFLEDADIKQNEKGQLEYLKQNLIKHSIISLFDEKLKDTSGYNIKRTGKKLIEDLFSNVCESLYPSYKTFIHSNQWRESITRYMSALSCIKVSQRRGHEELQGEKADIAALFGYTKLHAGFELLLGVWKENLLYSDWEKGKTAVIKFLIHPLEKEILGFIENNESISLDDVFKIGKNLGYTEEESDVALDLLANRQLICENNSIFSKYTADLSADELLFEIEELETLYHDLKDIDLTLDDKEIITKLEKYEEKAKNSEDYEILYEIKWELKSIRDTLKNKQKILENSLNNNLTGLTKKIDEIVRQSMPKELNENPQGVVGFVQPIVESKIRISAQYKSLKEKFTKLNDDIKKIQKLPRNSIDDLKELDTKNRGYKSQLEELQKDKNQLTKYMKGYVKWLNILEKSNQVYTNVSEYNEKIEPIDEFSRVQEYIKDVSYKFAEHKNEFLLDFENYETKIEEIEESYMAKEKQQNSLFDTKKEKYEALLRNIGFSGRLSSRLQKSDIEGSHRDLYKEIEHQFNESLSKKITEIEESRTNILHAKRIRGLNVDNLLIEVEGIKNSIEPLKEISIESIKNEDKFEDSINNIKELFVKYEEFKGNKIKLINQAKDAENELSKKVLEFVKKRRDLSLEDLLTDFDCSIEDMEDSLLELFKCNQIKISVSTRFRD
ncbi:DNA double-strand break repair Rad50 ATPase [Methanosarcina barkeri 3]|uniref:DNA double-strand break repair Rad50 ATPase n=1 Tax=Methanosarcina barkeri 3 TaxID=1434107 RepID=A0A0E3WXF4_METBA|nr:hypothetical protein [Methanosarcina barkeri]AKB82980.1 DNA double-strand break repair Rad50 ATPase [Methanosarcina barkeri 3]